LEPLEHFLISLAKEGLVEGELRFGNKAYKFSKVQGTAKVDVREMVPLLQETPATEKREPVFKRDERDLAASKIPKVRQAARPYKYLLFLLIFVAAILLAIFGIPYLSQSTGKKNPEVTLWNQVVELKTIDAFQNYLREYPQGQYSMDAIGRIEQIKQDQSKEIATRSQEEQSQIYLKQAQQAFGRNELQTALENLNRAKEIQESDQVRKLEERINERMDIDKKNQEFAGLITLAKAAIEQNQLDPASRYLNLAAEIKKDAQIDSLAARIEIKKAEAQKKTEDRKIDDVYNRYIKFARDYFDERNYAKALENVKKAKNIKSTDEVISMEKEIIRVRDGISTEKQRIAREKTRAKTEQVPQTRTVKLIELPPPDDQCL
jgi:tetratricopeptide (TPR) repeat protein